MKTKVVLLSFASSLFVLTAFGQAIENDDMYFNSKDRAKLRAQQPKEISYSASVKKVTKAQETEEEPINPTDSYSARNVNPEFTARSNAQAATADNQDYFVNNYQYQTSSNLNNWNNNFNNWNNSPWYGSNYYGSSINSWNSPYYGSSYDQWGNPWCNPYYQSGWSSSFSYYWGSPWNYGWNNGWGMNYGYGNNPYMNSYWGSSFGYGSGWYGNYPSTVVIVNNNYEDGRNISYGKRGTRGSSMVAEQNTSNNYGTRSRTTQIATETSGNTNSGGRVSAPTNRNRQEEYYNRSWRTSPTTGTTPSRSSRSSNDNWNWNNNSNSSNNDRSFDNNSSRSSSSYSPPSRSNEGGRSSSGSSGSSSSGGGRGRTRD